ncbi:MAG: hypothetical protein GY801_48635 [bacterium]|nr:hypothetical protein [bacterium]
MRPSIRGVVIEGLSHTGKTSTLKAIKRVQAHDEQGERSVLVLGEHYSQVLNTVHGELQRLTREEHLQLLRERLDMLEHLNDWACWLGDGKRRSRGLFFVFERFHLNHRCAFPDASTVEIGLIERRLYELGATTVLLTISPDIVEERIQSRSPHLWKDHTREALAQETETYIRGQARLVASAHQSSVPTIEMNTDDLNWDQYAHTILLEINTLSCEDG